MNLPTKVTVARIALIPIFILFYCLKEVFAQYYIPMTIVFIIASCTDFIDGNLARKHNMVTDLGKFLDPIADKILVVAGMIVLLDMTFTPSAGLSIGDFVFSASYPVLLPYFGVICVILILAREFIVGVFRQLAASKGLVMAADKLGKSKTIVTLVALPMLMMTPIIGENWHVAFNWFGVFILFAGWILFGVATILTIVSGFNYILKNKHVLATQKAGSEQTPSVETATNDMVSSQNENDVIDNVEVVAEDNKEEA